MRRRRVRIGLGHDDEEVADLPVGDEGLGAVQDIGVAVADGAGLDRGEVRPGSGLGHRDPEQRLPGDRAGQVLLFLRLAPELPQIGGADVGVEGKHQGVGAQIRELFHDDRVVSKPRVASAVLLWHVGAEEARLAHRQPGLAIGTTRLVPLGNLGRQFFLGKAPELVAEQVVFIGEDVSAHGVSEGGWIGVGLG